MVLARDTPSPHVEHLCSVISKSPMNDEFTVRPNCIMPILNLWHHMGLARATPSPYGERLCQVILKSPIEWWICHIRPFDVCVTLNFELWTWVLRAAHRLHMVNICAKLFQNLPRNDEFTVRTRSDGRTDVRTYTEPPLWQLSRATASGLDNKTRNKRACALTVKRRRNVMPKFYEDFSQYFVDFMEQRR